MTQQADAEVRGFERFVAARGRVLWRAAWVLIGDSHHAEDIVQSALSKCYLRYDTPRCSGWTRPISDTATDASPGGRPPPAAPAPP